MCDVPSEPKLTGSSRRGMLTLVLAAPLLLSIGCKGKRKWATPEPLVESAFPTSISLGAADSGAQLLSGFYPVEENWRWTKKDFSVVLGRPAGAVERGAAIVLAFHIPDVIIQKLTSIALYASVNGVMLPSETYDKSGDYTYVHDLPPASFTGEKVTIDFHLNKALAPTPSVPRELGIVATAVRFKSK